MKKSKINVLLSLVLILTIMISSIPASAATISISSKAETIYVGATVDLDVSGAKSVSWSSSDEKIAKVDKNGVVTGVKKGTAKITATSGSDKVSCIITVKKIALSKKSLELKVGETYTIKLKGAKAASFESKNEKIAKVSSSGVITAVGAGETTIVVKDKNGTSYKCTVTVPNPNKTELPKAYQTLINFIKKKGSKSDGEYLYSWSITKYGYDFIIVYNPKDETVDYWLYVNNATQIYNIKMDLNDRDICDVFAAYKSGSTQILGSGFIEGSSFKGENITFDFTGISSKSDKKEFTEYFSGYYDFMLELIGSHIGYYTKLKMSDIGFNKKYNDVD